LQSIISNCYASAKEFLVESKKGDLVNCHTILLEWSIYVIDAAQIKFDLFLMIILETFGALRN